MTKRQLVTAKLTDDVAERVLKSHASAIQELQAHPSMDSVILGPLQLPDGVGVQIAHKLGRKPRHYTVSPPDGAAAAGVIQDYKGQTPSGAPNDLTQTLSLRAIGFGRAITVTIEVK
jgi:hypothetical protein